MPQLISDNNLRSNVFEMKAAGASARNRAGSRMCVGEEEGRYSVAERL